MVNIFELLYKDIIKEYVKTHTAKVKTKLFPWVTRKIRKLMNKRYKALLKWQKKQERSSTENVIQEAEK